ncbi:MAG TPA: ABC transporter substrate-binding protein [Candidatus Binatia bacterium]|nr:ABC transporter substrate-binding protein [Candidatus Binatia bacterium]
MRRRWFARNLAIALSATALPARAQTAGVPIRVGCGLADTTAEAYYAADVGFFTKAGLNVAVTPYPSSGQVMTGVAGNAIDVAVSNTGILADAIRHGAPFVVIAGGGLYSSKAPNGALCVAKNSPIKTAQDLDGKIIAVPTLKDLTEVICRSWIDQNGGDSSKARIIEFPMSQMSAALERGNVDAALLAEPWLSSGRKHNAQVLAYAYNAVAPQFVVQLWYASAEFYRNNTSLVKRFADVINETARWANTHQAESAPILARWSHADLTTIAGMTRCRYATGLDPKLIDPILTALYKYRTIDRPITAAELLANR